MISELRQRVRQNGEAKITPEEFDLLQVEWITRAGAEDMVLAEREACAKVCEELREKWLHCEATHSVSDFMACAEIIRARSNAGVTERGAAKPEETKAD